MIVSTGYDTTTMTPAAAQPAAKFHEFCRLGAFAASEAEPRKPVPVEYRVE